MSESTELGLVVGSWADLRTRALPLRLSVFVQEQGVPIELEQDEQDELATHAIVQSALEVLATGRVVIVHPGLAKIGRLAVVKPKRGQGLGRVVLQALIEQAHRLGAKSVKLHAQCDAVRFYESAGFVSQGQPFDEAGIQHVLMIRDLATR